MTIIGSFLPDHVPWDEYWRSQGGYPPPRRPEFDRWREASSPGPRAGADIVIPIEIVGSRPHCEPVYVADEYSDDDQNLNNSSHMILRQRRRQHEGHHQSSKKSQLSAASINLDDYEDDCTHIEIQDCKAGTEAKEQSSRRLSVGDATSSKQIFIGDDSEEREINGTDGYSVYTYLKGFLSSTGRQIDAIKGDGNCFFRALSKIIYGNQKYYNEIRQAVVDVIQKHPRKFEAFADGPISEHIADMRHDKTWATQTEIYAAATLLNRDIYILSPDQTGETYRWLLFQPQVKYNNNLTGCDCCLTICHTHGNHYDRIAPLVGKCNCELGPPEMSGIKGHVDLT
ncbi:uncharacterized protein LOC127867825 [Dreissena polymorpha]|uniref:OTU domain-containing protein n=1 Tax=Dreissena polymorpha TaxID=45954 RepID=A0A9D4RJE4_DREPO|nr:uncharacterized protein LOC127867825 [Dreissena polymorpha]KAH3868607.1 hypothetical protein DPMN_031757 [Dreissena polymorpha]